MVNFLPGVTPLEVYRGDTFTQAFEFFQDDAETIPLALPTTGTWKAEVRETKSRRSPVLATFNVDASSAADGRLVVSLSAASVDALFPDCYWDVQHLEGENKRTYLAGPLTTLPDVTE